MGDIYKIKRDLRRFSLTRRSVYTQKTFLPLPYREKIVSMGIHAVTFESDDWGMCGEMKDRNSLRRVLEIEHQGEESANRMKYSNTLESYEDLTSLYSVLRSFKDSLGRSPIFTANYVMSNPDFKSIEKSNFSMYIDIPISQGFPDGWNDRGPVLRGWKEGMHLKVWRPEYHGLAHFNFKVWLNSLRNADKISKDFFEMSMVNYERKGTAVSEYVFDQKRGIFESYTNQHAYVSKGCRLFGALFGYKPLATIPPHDVWNAATELAFLKCGIRFIQSEKTRLAGAVFPPHKISLAPFGAMKTAMLIQIVITKILRNIWLEMNDDLDYAFEAFEYVSKSGFPAVIDTHRVNYVTGVNPVLADKGRNRLYKFLKFLSEDSHVNYLTVSELSQLYSEGYSILTFHDEILIRNVRNDTLKLPLSLKTYNATDITDQKVMNDRISYTDSSTEIPPMSAISFSL
ncbi:MAG: hypothetical protein QXV32_03645 [Conexivisphaerales archaeon]